MKDDGLPGWLVGVSTTSEWLDYLFKSNHSPDHKLCGTVISRTATYQRSRTLYICAISNYSISRILKKNSDEVQLLIAELADHGWIYPTGSAIGARKVYALTFSLIPQGEMRK